MTELSHDLDESYHDLNEDDHVREQTGFTETLFLEDTRSDLSKGLLYLLVLTCNGAG